MFKLPADFPSGGISNVSRHPDEASRADARHAARWARGQSDARLHLIGLSNADADKDRNLQLLKERNWFDIPVVYNNNRRAVIALEKGIPGDNVFADAFKAWSQQAAKR